MAAETIQQTNPVELDSLPHGMILFPREFLQKVGEVCVERWLLHDAQWYPQQVLGEGIVGSNEYDDPYTVCFVPVKNGYRYIKRSDGIKYPIIGGPTELRQRRTYQTRHGLAFNIVQPIDMGLAHMLLEL